jgi:hypothetical protein
MIRCAAHGDVFPRVDRALSLAHTPDDPKAPTVPPGRDMGHAHGKH